jgi:TonB family protein
MKSRTPRRIMTSILPLLIPLVLGSSGALGAARDAGNEVPDPASAGLSTDVTSTRLFHLRFLRARLKAADSGSALFKTSETIVPVSEREFWGRADQAEALREALAATQVEPLPGVVVKSGPAPDGGPHRFKAALGVTLVEVSFQGETLDSGWSRISVRVEGSHGEELLDAALRIHEPGTVALVAPLSASGDALVVGVTPLPAAQWSERLKLPAAEGQDFIYPKIVSKIMPVYPENARKVRMSGPVIVEAVIRTDGVPDRLVVLRMPEGGEWLAGAAVETIGKWRYQPATRGGIPVDCYFTIVTEFRLGDEP